MLVISFSKHVTQHDRDVTYITSIWTVKLDSSQLTTTTQAHLSGAYSPLIILQQDEYDTSRKWLRLHYKGQR